MKKTTTFLFLLLFAFSVSAQVTEYSYSFAPPKISIQGANHILEFENTQLQGVPGEPLLPYRAVNLLIPPGQETVGITITGHDEITLDGYFKITAAGFSRPLSETGFSPATEKEEIYTSDKTYPNKASGNLSTQYLNGFAFAQTVITPVKYIPAEGKISYFKKITVRIETRETPRGTAALKNLTSSEKVRARAIKSAQNHRTAATYPSPKASVDDYQILIVSPQTFATALQPLADLYLPRGMKSKFASIEFIQAGNTGVDLPEKIRNYIIQQYQQFGIEHVVLAGDVEHVPYRGFYCTVQSSSIMTDDNIPSDLYYSALDGNWNTNGNNLWGEIGEDDLLPDVSVGRMSFSNTTELAAMLNKTIKYQNEPVLDELRNPLMAGESLYDNPVTWGSDYLELLIGTHNDNGYTTTGIPADQNITRMYDEVQYWGASALMAKINTGPNFIHHVGHANWNYAMRLYNSDITNSNFSKVNGILHNFPIVYTHGCICGAFDENDCIGEKMVAIDNFASAFIGNSRYGWFNEGQTEGPSAHMHREFIDALFSDSLNRIGRAHMESKIETAPWVNAPGQWEEGALRWCFYDCNVLGDPVMAAWTNEPIEINTQYPANIVIGSALFRITVTSAGQPAAGLTAVLLKDGILYGKAITNNNGAAMVLIDPSTVTPGEAHWVISGYNCLPTYYPVTIHANVEDFESGDFLTQHWYDGGDAFWTISTENPYEGIYSARSGNILANQQSELIIPCAVHNPDSISFYYKVSSEQDNDFLRFYIDGVKKGEWSGTTNTGWNKASYTVQAGPQEYKWVYEKNGSVDSGEDAAWIDYIAFPVMDIGVGVEANDVYTSGLFVYPNPANGTITLSTGNAERGSQILITDVSGRIIKTLTGIAANQNLTIDISGIVPGIYFITNPGKTASKALKLIIQ